LTRENIFKVLSVLAVVAVFVLGIWLGRLYSAAGGPGVVTLQQFRSNVVLRIRQLWKPSATPSVPDSGSVVPRVSLEQLKGKLDAGADKGFGDVKALQVEFSRWEKAGYPVEK